MCYVALFWSLMQLVTEVAEAKDKPAVPLLAEKKQAAGAETGRGSSAARSAHPAALATSKTAASAALCSMEPSSEQVIFCIYVCLWNTMQGPWLIGAFASYRRGPLVKQVPMPLSGGSCLHSVIQVVWPGRGRVPHSSKLRSIRYHIKGGQWRWWRSVSAWKGVRWHQAAAASRISRWKSSWIRSEAQAPYYLYGSILACCRATAAVCCC